jgi:hypothetical protein
MTLKPNQLQVTTHKTQANAIIERMHKVFNDMFRSFDLENNHENLEVQEDNPFDYFLQSTAWSIRSTYYTTLQATPCQLVLAEIWSTILASEQTGIKYQKVNRTL